MRVHITLEEEIVRELDRRVGSRRRSAFISGAVRRALDDEARWELIDSAIGSIGDGHAWDDDPAAWVAAQRRSDDSRVG